MTPTECARLQSLEDICLPQLDSRSFKALGNAVNVEVVIRIADALVLTQRPPQQLYWSDTLSKISGEIKIPPASSDTRIAHHEQIREG